MFQELTQADILRAIDSLLERDYQKSTPYRVWFHGHLIPPKDIVRETYTIKGVSNPSPGFNTDQAQERLLSLGFPIVDFDKSGEEQFFSEKDLISFSRIVSRPSYDSNDRVDQNIGDYLYKIPWGKTDTWAKSLTRKNWIIKGHRNWNVQDKTYGQSYKKYTWLRIFPADFINELIFFTVGIALGGDLVYKLDIHRDNQTFPKNLIPYFDARRDEIGGVQRISSHQIKSYSWDRLITTTDQFFKAQLENYFKITNELWPEERLMRITWSRNNWEFPSGHKWSAKLQGTSEAHEKQYGFGHEEWLFNSRYRVNGFQFGYIRGVDQMSSERQLVNRLLLFTIDPDSKDRYLIGRLNDVEIIEGYEHEQRLIQPVIRNHFDMMLEELVNVGADVIHFREKGFVANVKFEWKKAEIFNAPFPFNQIKGGKYNRFQPYKIDDSLQAAINSELAGKARLSFLAGKAAHSSTYEKRTSSNKTIVERRHGTITDDLYDFHLQYGGLSADQLSCEKTRVGGQVVDFAINKSEVFTLFEVKTESVGMRNIRLAIGQLFEYALLDQSIKIEKLVIVGPADLNDQEIDYFQSLQALIRLAMEYWCYSFDETELKRKFKIIG